MLNTLLEDVNLLYPGRAFLTVLELADFLACDVKVIYNWTKRTDPKRQPPRLLIGKSLRFPKKEIIKWLAHEQLRSCGDGQ